MSIKKYSLFTIFTYGLVLYSPVIFQRAGLFQKGTEILQVTTVSYIVGAALLLIYYFRQKEPLEIEKNKPSALRIIGIGIIGIFGAMFVQAIMMQVEISVTHEQIVSQNTQHIVAMLKASPIFMLAAAVAGPIMEEFVFRRSLTGIIARYSNFWVGAILSSAAFALAHQDGHLLVYFSLGFFLVMIYKFTGRIWASMITHIGMNTVVLLVQLLLSQLK